MATDSNGLPVRRAVFIAWSKINLTQCRSVAIRPRCLVLVLFCCVLLIYLWPQIPAKVWNSMHSAGTLGSIH